jgi:hypothetical protein
MLRLHAVVTCPCVQCARRAASERNQCRRAGIGGAPMDFQVLLKRRKSGRAFEQRPVPLRQ